MQELKPVTRAKKKSYKANPAGNYQSSNKIFFKAKSEIDYIGRVNKAVQYGFGLLIRAELYKRGYTYRALYNLASEKGYKYKIGTITSIVNGSGHRWNLLILYKLAYVLNIDLDPLQIPEAISYLRANGRSVKEF